MICAKCHKDYTDDNFVHGSKYCFICDCEMFEVKYKRDLSKQIEIYNTAIGTKFENGHDFFDACLRGDIEKITITKVPILKNYLETAKGILFEISNRTDDKQLSIFDEQLPF